MSFPDLTVLNSVSAVVVEGEAIAVAERASSLTMSPDHLEGGHSCTLSTAGQVQAA
jgi:hypothetical protein